MVRLFETRKTVVHQEVKEYVEEMGIQRTEVSNRKAFQFTVEDNNGSQEKFRSCTRTDTVDRREKNPE